MHDTDGVHGGYGWRRIGKNREKGDGKYRLPTGGKIILKREIETRERARERAYVSMGNRVTEMNEN